MIQLLIDLVEGEDITSAESSSSLSADNGLVSRELGFRLPKFVFGSFQFLSQPLDFVRSFGQDTGDVLRCIFG